MMVAGAVSTPAVIVDEGRLDANIAAMADWSRAHGVALRPHVKTHKSVEIARRQVAAGAVGITVATVGEAEVFVAAGFEDVLIAYPLWLDPARADRLRALADHARITIGIDSIEAARQLSTSLPTTKIGVLVEIDSGHHRSGTSPEHAIDLATEAAALGVDVRGVFTFPGHAYSPSGRSAAAAEEASALRVAREGFAAAGLRCEVVSGGSTPSVEFADGSVLTELRPGVYVFGDAQQWELGSCRPDQIALSVLTTVVSRHRDHLIVDAGSKVMGADKAPFSTGFGRLLDHPEARITALSEHHATVVGVDAPLGSRLRTVPNHVCSTVNLNDSFVIVNHGSGIEQWPIDARGRNS